MATTTQRQTSTLEDVAKWDSAWHDDRSIEAGDVLRVPNGDDQYLYSIATGGGFGCQAKGMGSAIFVDHEERSLEDTLRKTNNNSACWEARWGKIQVLTNKAEVMALVGGPRTFELRLAEPAHDDVPGCGNYAAVLVDEESGKAKVVLAYNEECEQPFAIAMHKGIYEVYVRTVNGVYERSDDNTCTDCMRPTSKADSTTISMLGNNATTCKDCKARKDEE